MKKTLGLESSLTAQMVIMYIVECQRFVSFYAFLHFYYEIVLPSRSNGGFGFVQDYTGDDVTVNNFFAVILGNRTALTGGSGKVVDSGPNDHIFIYYSDHGGPGVLG